MHQGLAEELRRRAQRDQAARQRAAQTRDAAEMRHIDDENTAWLEGVIEEHGWPGIGMVGEQGAKEAWLIAQHADRDPAFQSRALELMKTAVAVGEASARHLAYLTDRTLVAASKPQKYGTQYTHDPDGSNLRPQPVEDPEHLDERRAAVGLEPAADYDRRMRS